MKTIIGQDAIVEVLGQKEIPAKIDTGADSSAIWVSNVKITKDNILKFKLFDKQSPFFTNKTISRKDFRVVATRSSHGDQKIFYRTHIPMTIEGRKIRVLFTLADRSNNQYPILIGKRTIKNRFIVDVSKKLIQNHKPKISNSLNKEFQKNPHKFHQKYIEERSSK